MKGNATENPYNRGAMVYWYLQSTMGDRAFFSFMREFFERYAGQNVTTSDFLSFAGDHGIDIERIEDLLYENALPVWAERFMEL
jgi:aminopeptidase N